MLTVCLLSYKHFSAVNAVCAEASCTLRVHPTKSTALVKATFEHAQCSAQAPPTSLTTTLTTTTSKTTAQTSTRTTATSSTHGRRAGQEFLVGQRVSVVYPQLKQTFAGRVVSKQQDGTITVDFDPSATEPQGSVTNIKPPYAFVRALT